MKVNGDIQHKKKIFQLPYHKDQLEYWGPVNSILADSFLTMGHKFIYQYFANHDARFLKTVFSSFVELVQNVSEYNEESFKENCPQSFIRLKDGGSCILINTVNQIRLEDRLSVETTFSKVFAIPEVELQKVYKEALFSGNSLGLIMLRKIKNTSIEYSFSESQEGEIWLSIELKMNYGNT